jgi:filamentous hemagglutinin family protein
MKKSKLSQARRRRARRQFFQASKAYVSSVNFNAINLNGMRLRDIPFALALAFGSLSSHADPVGGEVAAGAATISAINGITTVQQMSDRAIVNWQSFNVNAGEAVKFVQPSSTAAILNRVTGGSVSNISGLLEGNGRVYLINPNGIVIGANGIVNVNGGFVASTQGIADSAFMQNGALIFTGESTGSIQVLGKVQSSQGDIILIAPKVAIEQTGQLIAGQTIKLVAANEVELSNGKLTVKPKAQDAGQITVEGALTAAQVQLKANNNNLGALAINTSGRIHATGTQTNPDGSVTMIATGQGGNLNLSGNIRSEKGDGNGGAVTILADNGIRINGTIDANSSNASSTDTSKKGGDIYIGRDITTNKLAKATDVSGATLLSNRGFVETSGDWLKTNNITVLAKDWLLDPTDINIVAADTATPDTISSSPSGVLTFQDTLGRNVSEVLKSTIESAINAGTSVTISTANSTFGANGSGNITIATALSFNNTGSQDATLRLFAVNGITQNTGSTITAIGSKNVNIELVSEGRHMGVNAPNVNSLGIVINSAIDTNGTIKIDGLNRNTGSNSVGVTFNSGSSIKAASFDIKGSATSLFQASHGVAINSSTSFTSTSTDIISKINGTSLTNGSLPSNNGVTAGTNINGTNIRFDAGAGSMVVKGSNANTQLGLRVSASGDNTTVITDGNVTLGALEANSNFYMRAGTITANSGSLTILGSSVANYGGESITANNGVSIKIEGQTPPSPALGFNSNAVALTNIAIKALQGTTASAGNIDITGTASTGSAINLASTVILEGGNVSLKGTATSGAGVNGTGKITASGAVNIVGISANTGGYSTVTNGPIVATGDITIKGTGTARHGVFLGSNVVGNNITSTAGKITIEGDTTGAGGITGSAVGTAITGNAIITADKDVTITGKTNGYYSINGLGNITSNNGNVSIDGYSRDSRGVNYANTITANNGNINIIGGSGVDGTITSTEASAGNEHGVYFSGLAKANNVTITGRSINNVGTFVGSSSGTNIDATNKVTITGLSTASTGVNLGSTNGNAAFNATIKSGGDTSVTGTGVTGVRVWAGSNIDAKNIDVFGTAVTRTAGDVGIGVDFERIVATANFKSSEDINIEGTLTGAGIGSGVKTSWRNQNGSSPVMNAGGNFTLRGNNRALVTNTNAAVNADSGLQVTAGKNIVVQAETNNADVRAMVFYSLGDMYRGNTSLVSTGGDVLIQSNQGAITFNNQQSSSIGKLTDITGRNITIDNTGAGMATGAGSLVGSGGTKGGTIGSGSINTTTGVVVAGAGKGNAEGINFADGRNITATGQLNIMGAAKSGLGVQNITTLTGGTVNIKGISDGNSAGINTTGRIVSTVGDINLEGTSALGAGVNMTSNAATPAIEAKKNVIIKGTSNNTVNDARHGVVLLGTTTVQGENVTIEGSSVNGNGVINNAAINATSGDVKITGTSTGTTASASALSLQGAITASNNVAIVGNNTKAANASMIAYINKAITATNGKVDVTTQTAGTAAAGLRLDTGTNLTGKTEVNIKTDSLNMTTTGSAPALISAGTTGLVTIKTNSAGTKIDIGNGTSASGVDVGSTATSARVLGLSNAELDRINAGNLVIGDVLNTGGIKVSAATTTLAQAGNITLQTGGNVAIDNVLAVDSTKTLTLNAGGAVTNGTLGAIKASKLELLGSNAAVTLDNKLHEVGTLAANVKSLNFANKTALVVGAVNTINSTDQTTGTVGITAKDGISVTTQTGDLNLNEVISNTSAGDVIVGAGVSKAAGDKTGGDVKTTTGKNIVHANGKLYVYSGSTAATGLLSILDADFAELRLSGDMGEAQNTASNTEYKTSENLNKIIDGADAQIMFREKISLDTSTIVGAVLEKTYGDANTTKLSADQDALFTQMKEKLTQANQGEIITRTTSVDQGVNVIKISKAALINDLTGALTSPEYSTSDYLTAKTHDYDALTSSQYTASLAAAKAQVNIAKKALTGSIGLGSSTYGSALNLGTATLSNVESGDTVIAGASKIDLTTANTSTSGYLKAGTHTQTLSGITGDDAANYSFANVTGDYKVIKKEVVVNAVQTIRNFTGTLQTQLEPVKVGFVVGVDGRNDVVNIKGLAKGTAVGSYWSRLEVEGGADAGNYNVQFTNAALVIDYGGVIPPNQPQRYVPLASDTVNLAPVTFAMGIAPATAAGDEADPNVCYAWGQRNGGDVVVHTVLKPTYLGLRNAKTDTQEAASNSSGATSHAASQCGQDASTKVSEADNI